MGPFWGGMPPVVAPSVTWVSGESRVALFIELLSFTFVPPTGVLGFAIYNGKNLEILAKDRSDVAVGCSKRW
jgi:hypothetical protein